MNEEICELNYQDFVRARNLFQQQLGVDASAAEGEDGSNSMLYSAGPNQLFAVFDEWQHRGWFYLFDAKAREVLRGAYIYDCEKVAVEEDVVDIGWAADDSACGLALWGEFRAFFGTSSDLEISKPVINADEDGIPCSEWPAGFDHYLEKNLD